MPTIHAASNVDYGKRVVWFSISMHACGSVPIIIIVVLLAYASWLSYQ